MNSENINKIYELSEKYDNCQDKNEKISIENELKLGYLPIKLSYIWDFVL